MRARPTALAVASALLLAACGDGGSPTRVELTMHYSAFSPRTLTVPRGVPVTLVLRNDDPIAHEWIVGDDSVHERHRTGTEPVHGERPTELTVPGLAERTTVVTFERPGDYRFVCHLPGHESYGMTGVLRVV
ncbi:MAG TPA: cupredoxin domain-containing protein [Mycobacteriales bacterium]|nr:cupredoxin domain-containing protein [Mycobacteriales bacterium]